MNIKRILPMLLTAAVFCGCGESGDTEDTTVSESETIETTTENEYKYALVRGWTGKELLDSIFYCGEYHSLPLVPEENDGFTLSENVLIFPDGTYAFAETNEDGEVTFLRFERMSSPMDFSVYGVGFDSFPDDIPQNIGIADNIYGDKEETIVYSFYDGGISELTFSYTNKQLEYVQIRC